MFLIQCNGKEKQICAEYYEFLLYHKYISYIKALSRMPELQANGFIQTKIHCKGRRRINMSTFDGNFHEFLPKVSKES